MKLFKRSKQNKKTTKDSEEATTESLDSKKVEGVEASPQVVSLVKSHETLNKSIGDLTEATLDDATESSLDSPLRSSVVSPPSPKSASGSSFTLGRARPTPENERVEACTRYSSDGGRAFSMSWSQMERAVIQEREKRHRARELQIYGYERNQESFKERAAMFESSK